jgi:hypothetical protein
VRSGTLISMSHPWFTLIGGGCCIWVIYLLAKIFIDIEKRFSDLRSAREGLIHFSVCRCNNAGTSIHCRASKVLEKEERIARKMREARIDMMPGRTSERFSLTYPEAYSPLKFRPPTSAPNPTPKQNPTAMS